MLDGIIPCLINEYTRQSLSYTPRSQPQAHTGTDDAMAVTDGNYIRHPVSEITCFKCGQKGHYQSDCALPQKVTGSANAIEPLDDDSF
jgi:hypothetical protein